MWSNPSLERPWSLAAMTTAMQQLLGLVVLSTMLTPSFGASPSNPRLIELRDADQADRSTGRDSINWSVVSVRDAARRTEVHKLLADGLLRTSGDYQAAALIFQHGEGVEDIRLAHSLATIARDLDPKNRGATFLIAATWDRLMMRLKRPQWYATQFVKQGGRWVLYDIDESVVTDEERKRIGGRTLAEARILAESMNAETKSAP
jgi:hypothetical protein